MSKNIMKRSMVKEACDQVAKCFPKKTITIIGSSAIAVAHQDENIRNKLANTGDIDLCLTGVSRKEREELDQYIGKGSLYEHQNGYYIQLLDDIFIQRLADGWEERATQLNKNAKALSPIDLAYKKIYTSRGKDIKYVANMLDLQIVSYADISAIIETTNKNPKRYKTLKHGFDSVLLHKQKNKKGHEERILNQLEKNVGIHREDQINRGLLGITFHGLSTKNQIIIKKLETKYYSQLISATKFLEKFNKLFNDDTRLKDNKVVTHDSTTKSV